MAVAQHDANLGGRQALLRKLRHCGQRGAMAWAAARHRLVAAGPPAADSQRTILLDVSRVGLNPAGGRALVGQRRVCSDAAGGRRERGKMVPRQKEGEPGLPADAPLIPLPGACTAGGEGRGATKHGVECGRLKTGRAAATHCAPSWRQRRVARRGRRAGAATTGRWLAAARGRCGRGRRRTPELPRVERLRLSLPSRRSLASPNLPSARWMEVEVTREIVLGAAVAAASCPGWLLRTACLLSPPCQATPPASPGTTTSARRPRAATAARASAATQYSST